MATTPDPHARAPLWAALTITFLASLGTGGITNGVFFLTENAFGYGRATNYALGLTMGAIYIGAAALVGRAARALVQRASWFDERRLVGAALGAIGACCFLPLGASALAGSAQAWTIWVLIVVFSVSTGVLWPTMESFLSGSRRGADLRSAIGRFNVVWAVALVAAFWGMAPIQQERPLTVIAGLGVVHLSAIVFLRWLPRSPGRHDPNAFEHEPHPDSYRTLLGVFRALLPVTYLVLGTLAAYFPSAVERLGVADGWQMPVVSAWMIARVGCFLAFERWHGWHGRLWFPGAGYGVLMLGFVGCVVAPMGGGDAGVAVLIGGLSLLGAGMSTVYVGALYYGMEVGRAEVDAGGTHEAFIGLGYAAGPLCGLIAVLATRESPERFTGVLLGIGLVASVVWSAVGIGLASRRSRPGDATPPAPGR